jgi:hypothetical protein
MLGIPFRGKKIGANIRNSVPKHVSDKNMRSILFGGARFFVKLMPFSSVPSLGIDSSVYLGIPRNEHFLPRNNGNHSESIPRNFFGNSLANPTLHPPPHTASISNSILGLDYEAIIPVKNLTKINVKLKYR